MLSAYGKPNRAPVVFDNTLGLLPWSGFYEYMLTESLIESMMIYIRSTARRYGYNHALSGSKLNTSNIFSPEFLDGQPFWAWENSYLQGVGEFRDKFPLASAVIISGEDIEART